MSVPGGDLAKMSPQELAQLVAAFKRQQRARELAVIDQAIERVSGQLAYLLETRRQLLAEPLIEVPSIPLASPSAASSLVADDRSDGFVCRRPGCGRVLRSAGGRASHERSHVRR